VKFILFMCGISFINAVSFEEAAVAARGQADVEVLKQYLDGPNGPDDDRDSQEKGMSLLMLAATRHSCYARLCGQGPEAVKILLEAGADVNYQNFEDRFTPGISALYLAAQWANRWESTETLQLLLNHPDIDVNIRTEQGDSVLGAAASNDEVISLLKEAGAVCKCISEKCRRLSYGNCGFSRDYIISLCGVCLQYRQTIPEAVTFDEAEKAVKGNADIQILSVYLNFNLADTTDFPDQKIWSSYTLLEIAARYGNNQAIEILLQDGADINHGGVKALYLAADWGRTESVRLLLQDPKLDLSLFDTSNLDSDWLSTEYPDIWRLLKEAGVDL